MSRRKDSGFPGVRAGKEKAEERERGAEIGYWDWELERVVRVAWVEAGRELGLGRWVEGGIVIVREEAAERAERRKRRRDGRYMVVVVVEVLLW